MELGTFLEQMSHDFFTLQACISGVHNEASQYDNPVIENVHFGLHLQFERLENQFKDLHTTLISNSLGHIDIIQDENKNKPEIEKLLNVPFNQLSREDQDKKFDALKQILLKEDMVINLNLPVVDIGK